ncbi:MAG: UbiX family flavin prenyltransferase [Clostridiales bacterium]|nr:UbiX family flavin prenyltransferase [Clostridiales bacterium]
MRLIVGISGASGVIMGYRLLQALRQHPGMETHLVVSEGAFRIFEVETDIPFETVKEAADYNYDNNNLSALISSGSFVTDGMIVMPCSMKTLSGVAQGYSDNLLIRAVDVCLKEGRKVVLVPREMPFSRVHIHNLQKAAEFGCAVVPPMLTFYNHLDSAEEQVQHVIGKVLMQFGLEHKEFVPWRGI